MKVGKESFADEKSRRIFEYRKKYCETGEMDYILEMICDEYVEFANRWYSMVSSTTKSFMRDLKSVEREYVIYGTGVNAGRLYDIMVNYGFGDKVKLFCQTVVDNRRFKDKSVKGVSELNEEKNSCCVLVTDGNYSSEMISELESSGWEEEYYRLVPYEVIEGGITETERIRPDFKDIILNKNNHFALYGYDWNWQLFRHIMRTANRNADFVIAETDGKDDLKYISNDPNMYIVVTSSEKNRKLILGGVPEDKIIRFYRLDELQYFDDEVVPKHISGRDEVFVDGGSLNLYTSKCFLKWCSNECSKIIAFECDDRCVELCNNEMKMNKKLGDVTDLIPKGMWSKTGQLEFSICDNFGSSSAVIQNTANKITIPTESLDNIVGDEKVTFIKMDIEGAELEALKGCEKTIRNYHPTLAISVYHKKEDIIEIPEYIHSINPEYKLYLRNYHQDHTETVLYAICE